MKFNELVKLLERNWFEVIKEKAPFATGKEGLNRLICVD
jgi:hypothetical protein